MCAARPSSGTAGDGALVAHVVIVGFHAQLGNRIEFAYPRLRGDAVLRSPDLGDSLDISADPYSPSVSPRPYVTGLTPPAPVGARAAAAAAAHPPSPGGRRGDWGSLPDEWRFLPFMALPEGVHESDSEVVFFKLEPDVHCVSCFRQAEAAGSVTHSASGGRGYERGVAARGSVQKSVVLLCRRPLYGHLAARLAPVVRSYFEQADFAKTDVLASFFHSLNVSLARPALANVTTLFHGLDLRALIRRIGPHILAVLKLIMLEKRVVFYSQPVAAASNAVVAFASILPGAFDAMAPTVPALDEDPANAAYGFPLALFGSRDRVVLQPYAPLPHISELLHMENDDPVGCLIATSHNVGMLLSSAASAASRERSMSPPTSSLSPPRTGIPRASPTRPVGRPASPPPSGMHTPDHVVRRGAPWINGHASDGDEPSAVRPPAFSRSLPQLGTPASVSRATATPQRAGGGRLPIVDALVNLSTGRVSVSGAIEPFVRVTRAERHFMRDLMASTAGPVPSATESDITGALRGSDEHVRGRLRAYLRALLGSVAAIPGVAGGPSPSLSRGFEPRWTRAEVASFDLADLGGFNEKFVRKWLTTRNAAIWARKVSPRVAIVRPPPLPELLVDSSSDEGAQAFLPPVENMVSGFTRFSAKAAKGLYNFFGLVDVDVGSVGAGNGTGERRGAVLENSTVRTNGVVPGVASPPRKAPPPRPHPPQAHLRYGDGSPQTPKVFSYIDPNAGKK